MPIQSTKTTSIPGLAAPSTPDLLAYGVVISPVFPDSGVTANLVLSLVPYRANSDGTGPQIVGERTSISLGELAALATASPSLAANLAAAKTALDAVVQALVTAKGL